MYYILEIVVHYVEREACLRNRFVMLDPEFDVEWFTVSVDTVSIRSDDFDPSDVRSTTELLSGTDVNRSCRALREIGRNSKRH
jgi:hypothetical protein